MLHNIVWYTDLLPDFLKKGSTGTVILAITNKPIAKDVDT